MSDAARDWSSSEAEKPPRPMRIEFATSELEGGPCRAWADPSYVLGAIAVSDPSDAFAKYVQPHLEELDAFGSTTAGQLPPIVDQLVERLQQVHGRLARDAEGGERAATIALTCAVVEEDRIFFLKTGPTWIGLVRGGRAHPVERPDETDVGPPVGLGTSGKLGLEVTSLPIEPGDVIVLLCSDMRTSPDLRAVANVFGQTTDLRRACDGLVNLLGLQSEGAGAVAFRFVPVAGSHSGPEPGLLAELREVPPVAPVAKRPAVEDPFAAMTTAMPRPKPRSAPLSANPGSEAESFLDSLGGDPDPVKIPRALAAAPSAVRESPVIPAQSTDSVPSATTREAEMRVVEADGGGSFASAVAGSEPRAGSVTSETTQRGEGLPSAADRNDRGGHGGRPTGGGGASRSRSDRTDLSRHRAGRTSRRNLLIPVLIAIAVAVLLALLALPGGPNLPGRDGLKGLLGSAESATGELVIAPDPPAERVLLDGEQVAVGTPATLAEVAVGRHRVSLDYGATGTWETEVDVVAGSNSVVPTLTGSVRIAAADPSRAGRAWIDGGRKVDLPATLTDIPIGWVRVYYEDENVPVWERQVLIRSDRVAPLIVPNDVAEGEGRVRVEALAYWESRGLEDSSGDSVWVDNRHVGSTPFEGAIDPGLHSIRVQSQDGESFTDMISVHAGAARHVLAQFGVSERPTLHHTPPGRVMLSGKLILTVEVLGEMDPLSARPSLHFPELAAPHREIGLTAVEAGEQVFVAVIDPIAMPRRSSIPYYFTILGPDGRPAYSDLYHLILEEAGGSSAHLRGGESKAMANQVTPTSRGMNSASESSISSVVIEPATPPQTTASQPARFAERSGSELTREERSTTAPAASQVNGAPDTPTAEPGSEGAKSWSAPAIMEVPVALDDSVESALPSPSRSLRVRTSEP